MKQTTWPTFLVFYLKYIKSDFVDSADSVPISFLPRIRMFAWVSSSPFFITLEIDFKFSS